MAACTSVETVRSLEAAHIPPGTVCISVSSRKLKPKPREEAPSSSPSPVPASLQGEPVLPSPSSALICPSSLFSREPDEHDGPDGFSPAVLFIFIIMIKMPFVTQSQLILLCGKIVLFLFCQVKYH